MDALRKFSSLGRNRDVKTEVASSSSPEVEVPGVEKSSREEELHMTGLTPIRVRTPSEKDERDDAESVGSADSFDSALERMAASSITSFEPSSPVGSVDARSQYEGGGVEGLPGRERERNSYDEYDEDDENEEETGGNRLAYSSSASNTEDELDYTGASFKPVGRFVRSDEDHEEDVEDEFEEADDGGTDSGSEELEDTVFGGRMKEELEAGVSLRDPASALESTVQESTSAFNDDDEEFAVKSSVKGSKYKVYDDSQEGDDLQEEGKIIGVNREHNIEGGEKDGLNSLVVVKKELPKDVAEDLRVLASPALPTLGRSDSGDVDQSEQTQASSPTFGTVDYSGEEGDSDGDGDVEDEYHENDEEDEDEYDGAIRAKAQLEQAARSGSGNEIASKPSMGAAGPSLPSLPKRPTKKAVVATDTAGRITQQPTASSPTELTSTTEETTNNESNETRDKLQNIRVKFLRLAHRLGQSPQNQVVAQVLYRLGLAESLRGGSTQNRTAAFSFDRANALATEAEATHQDEELDFACTILVLGKTGVGKSATINSIFDERKSLTSAFSPSTKKVHEIVGTVHGIKVRVIDTPGLLPSTAEQRHNETIMGQVKRHIKKSSPDIVLYFDRLDMQPRDLGDVPLLRTITDVFGAAVWFNAIVVLTHAGSAPPDGPNGAPLNYDMFLAQRSHVVQQTIRQAAGDMRLSNPVSLVENHPACRTNRSGQRVLPNGQIWKSQLLLLCFASKILAEANTLLKLFETATPGKPFGQQRPRVPPLPFLLSSLLQSRAQLQLPNAMQEESDVSDDDDDEDDEEDDEYDELPPFRPLAKEELEELSTEQKHQYAEELADRERLFQKKQYREQIRRRKEMRKQAAAMSEEELPQAGADADDDSGQAASVPVPMPDMVLPPSFDSDTPTHRYRYLETANQWLVRPVLETHGWDHDAGYEGLNVEKMFVLKDKIPASISAQVTKDKKEAQVSFEAAASLKHGEGKVTLTGFDVQTIGKDLAYTLRAETRFNNFKRNKTTGGLTCTVLNDTIAAGLKLEDRLLIGKRIKMVVNGGVLTGKGDKAFGGSLEATLRGKEYPLSRTLSTLGLSVMDWHGDLAIGGNLQSQFMVGKTMLVGRANLNNRGSGQVSIRASSSEQLQMVLIGIVPVLRSLINCRFGFGGQPSE